MRWVAVVARVVGSASMDPNLIVPCVYMCRVRALSVDYFEFIYESILVWDNAGYLTGGNNELFSIDVTVIFWKLIRTKKLLGCIITVSEALYFLDFFYQNTTQSYVIIISD